MKADNHASQQSGIHAGKAENMKGTRVRASYNRYLTVARPFDVPGVGRVGELEFFVTLPTVYEVGEVAEPTGSAAENEAIRVSFSIGNGLQFHHPAALDGFEIDGWSVGVLSTAGWNITPVPVSRETFDRILAEHAGRIGDDDLLDSNSYGLVLADSPGELRADSGQADDADARIAPPDLPAVPDDGMPATEEEVEQLTLARESAPGYTLGLLRRNRRVALAAMKEHAA